MKDKKINLKELEYWAWLNLKDITDEEEYREQVKVAAQAFYGVSYPTAKDYANIITGRRFLTNLPDSKKQDFMLQKGYDLDAETNIEREIQKEKIEMEIIEQKMIAQRDRRRTGCCRLEDEQIVHGDVPIVKENIPEED